MGRVKGVKGERGSQPQKGHPLAGGAPDKIVEDLDKIIEAREMEVKYTDDIDKVSSNVHLRHPNRNTDKPDIDKPPYS